MLPNILVYIGLVFCTAWGHSASLARNIIFYAIVIVGAAAFLAPFLGMTIDATGLLSLLSNPKFGAGLFGAIILSRLLCAPYWIWQDDQKKISSLGAHDSERQRRRNYNIAKLQGFYVAVGPIITRSLPKEISETDFNKYSEEANAWANNCATWIAENMGAPAQERFSDRTDMKSAFLTGAVNDTHSRIIKNLTRLSQNLQVLIENYDAWDGVTKRNDDAT